MQNEVISELEEDPNTKPDKHMMENEPIYGSLFSLYPCVLTRRLLFILLKTQIQKDPL